MRERRGVVSRYHEEYRRRRCSHVGTQGRSHGERSAARQIRGYDHQVWGFTTRRFQRMARVLKGRNREALRFQMQAAPLPQGGVVFDEDNSLHIGPPELALHSCSMRSCKRRTALRCMRARVLTAQAHRPRGDRGGKFPRGPSRSPPSMVVPLSFQSTAGIQLNRPVRFDEDSLRLRE